MNKFSNNQGRKLWFKAKHYGWGWYPCSWQGVIVVLLFVFLLFPLVKFSANSEPSKSVLGIAAIIILVALLFYLSYKKGEKPGWRWGNCTGKSKK